MEDIKKLQCIHLADRRNSEKLCNALEEVKFLNAVIDMMAEDISSSDLFTWDGSSELVKQYYFKKARGEESVKD